MRAVTYVDERGNEFLALVTRIDPTEDEDAKPTVSVAFVNIDGIDDMHGTALSRRSGVPHESTLEDAERPEDLDKDAPFNSKGAPYWKQRRSL